MASFRKIIVMAVLMDLHVCSWSIYSDTFRRFGKFLGISTIQVALLGCCRRFDASTTFMSLTQANSSVESKTCPVKSHTLGRNTGMEPGPDAAGNSFFFYRREKTF